MIRVNGRDVEDRDGATIADLLALAFPLGRRTTLVLNQHRVFPVHV